MSFPWRRSDPPGMTLEGPLGPNDRLEQADGILIDAPDALSVTADGKLLASSGNRIVAFDTWGGPPKPWGDFGKPVTALTASSGGKVAIGLAGGEIVIRDQAGGAAETWPALPEGMEANDCVFVSENELLVASSGYRHDEDILPMATWDDRPRGSVIAVSRSDSARLVATDLHCPTGICLDAAGQRVIALLERASLVDLAGNTLQAGYPAYLGRVRRTSNGYALACLSRRDPLIDFLKQEPEFVADMKGKLDPRHWIAPRRSPEPSHELPIELGATRLFGEIKPWAPSFSYGLIIETDENFLPLASAHSRANGRRHAISDVAEWNGNLMAVSRASGEILNLGPARAPS